MPTWPTTNSMPQVFPMGTKEEALGNTIASDMEHGPRKIRPRYTSLVRFLEVDSARFVLTNAQKVDLLTFHDTTTNFGALTFTWGSTGPVPEFNGDTTQKFRFDGRPQVQCIVPGADADRRYSCALRVELVPV